MVSTTRAAVNSPSAAERVEPQASGAGRYEEHIEQAGYACSPPTRILSELVRRDTGAQMETEMVMGGKAVLKLFTQRERDISPIVDGLLGRHISKKYPSTTIQPILDRAGRSDHLLQKLSGGSIPSELTDMGFGGTFLKESVLDTSGRSEYRRRRCSRRPPTSKRPTGSTDRTGGLSVRLRTGQRSGRTTYEGDSNRSSKRRTFSPPMSTHQLFEM